MRGGFGELRVSVDGKDVYKASRLLYPRPAPRGWGWLTNPRRAAYNRVYNRTTKGCAVVASWSG